MGLVGFALREIGCMTLQEIGTVELASPLQLKFLSQVVWMPRLLPLGTSSPPVWASSLPSSVTLACPIW